MWIMETNLEKRQKKALLKFCCTNTNVLAIDLLIHVSTCLWVSKCMVEDTCCIQLYKNIVTMGSGGMLQLMPGIELSWVEVGCNNKHENQFDFMKSKSFQGHLLDSYFDWKIKYFPKQLTYFLKIVGLWVVKQSIKHNVKMHVASVLPYKIRKQF